MKFNPLQNRVVCPNYQHAELPVHFYIRHEGPLGGMDDIRHQVRSAIIELSSPDIEFFEGSNETFNPVRQTVAGRVNGRVIDAFAKILDYDRPKLEVDDCLYLVETQIHSAIYSMYQSNI